MQAARADRHRAYSLASFSNQPASQPHRADQASHIVRIVSATERIHGGRAGGDKSERRVAAQAG